MLINQGIGTYHSTLKPPANSVFSISKLASFAPANKQNSNLNLLGAASAVLSISRP